jgi:ABC-type sugar transport system permease subunit/ABC-type glycerol-3-phosphate transport system substrate-binding protein
MKPALATVRILAIACCAILAASASHAAPLRFWAVTSSVQDVTMYRQLAADFTRRTGIAVEVTPLAWGNFATKYFAAMAAGLPPDIGVTNLGGPFDYGSVGGLVDLRAEFPNEIAAVESQYPPQLLGQYTLGTKLYGLPNELSTVLLYYRTDIFEKLGLRAPKTWSELNHVIGTLEANNYRYYFGFTNNAQWALPLYTMPYGLSGYRYGKDGRPEVLWNAPDYQKGVMQALRLWHMHDSPGKDLESRVIGMFRSSEPGVAIPLMLEVHANEASIDSNAPEIQGKWAIAPWPRADDGKPFNVIGGTTYVIFRKSKLKREAFQWLKYLNTLEAQRAMILNRLNRGDESSLSISPLPEVWGPANAAFWSQPAVRKHERLRRVMEEILPTFRTVQPIQGAVEAGRIESNLLDRMSTFIRDRLDREATDRRISRSQLIRQFGSGKMEAIRLTVEDEIAQRLKQEYAVATPQAQEILRQKTAHYEARYSRIIDELPTYEKRRSMLDSMKVAGVVILAVLAAIVLAEPRYRRHLPSYLFVAPPIVLAVVFVFVPAVTALYLSFTDYHPVLPLATARWVGAENYVEVAKSGDLAGSIVRTFRYVVFSLPIGIVISLVFAYLLNSRLRGERYWRFLYFSPLVTSVVSIALIFSQLFLGGTQGWLNAILMKLGAIRDPIPFLTSEHTFLDCVITLAIWHGLAFTILVLLAGLQQISEQLYEAASVDGAGPIRQFWHVAIPGLRPQIFFLTVLGVIGGFQVFETIYTLAGKSGDAGARFGPNDSALTMVPLIYHTGFETFEMGKSAAIAYVLFALILAVTALQLRFYRRREA